MRCLLGQAEAAPCTEPLPSGPCPVPHRQPGTKGDSGSLLSNKIGWETAASELIVGAAENEAAHLKCLKWLKPCCHRWKTITLCQVLLCCRFLVHWGLHAWAKNGADGRANPLSWARGATGNTVAGRGNKNCHKKAPLVLFSSWKAVTASKLRHLLQVRIVELFLESFSPFPIGFLVLWHPEKKK